MQPKQATPLHTPRMRRLGPGRWLVESRTQAGLGHQCTVDACGCKAGQYGRMCHHRKLVIRAEAWLASYAATAQTSAPAPVPAAPVQQTGALRPLSSYFE